MANSNEDAGKVNAKRKEIISSLSERTGVDGDAVAKILDNLGFEESLRQRAKNDRRLGKDSLGSVSDATIRLSSSDTSQ